MRPIALLPSLIVLAAFVGCGGGSAPLPSTSASRQALQASLDAWKAGKPASTLTAQKPSIEAVDFEWKGGKVLTEYVLGEDSPGQGTQTFSATLTLKGEPAVKSVQYMVLGLDPIRIYRDEDFKRAMNMDNGPTPANKAKR
jgi:hypothetical protein